MSYIDKEKLIKADIASIENRVRHAFNQGYDLGFKDGIKGSIPKADYEARLKADLKAILVELQLEIECCEKSDCDYASSDCLSQWQIDILIQQKINALSGTKTGT